MSIPAPAGPADALLRPALQLALDVARIGAAASPAAEVPRALRPFLHFTRMPEQALTAVRRALDEDEGFRARVEALADEGELGRAGWLFVVRPPGWEEEYAGLSDRARAQAEAAREEREERSARRRLAAAEEARERAEAEAARRRAEAARAAADLVRERQERRAAHDEVARLARRVTSLEAERDSARRRAADAADEGERLAVEVRRLEAEAQRVRAEVAPPAAGSGRPVGGPPPAPPVPVSRVEPSTTGGVGPAEARAVSAAVARAVAEAAAAAGALSEALAEASAALLPPRPGVGAGPGPAAPSGESGARPRPPPSRRRPPGLPPAVLDDTADAAAHLVRVPDVLVLVDGYNAAKALWPEVAPLELRERLVDALSELAARTGAGVHVVFDGADLGGLRPRPGRTGVRVSFSPPDVEADDVILALVDETPLSRPVVVASSDRRVQDGARERGAGVVSSAQLAAVLGRS